LDRVCKEQGVAAGALGTGRARAGGGNEIGIVHVERRVGETEVNFALNPVAQLSHANRTGYLWLKARSPEAVKIKTTRLALPEGEEFRRLIEGLREEPRLGGRLPRSGYERIMRERDEEWLEAREESNLQERWEKKYTEERA